MRKEGKDIHPSQGAFALCSTLQIFTAFLEVPAFTERVLCASELVAWCEATAGSSCPARDYVFLGFLHLGGCVTKSWPMGHVWKQ